MLQRRERLLCQPFRAVAYGLMAHKRPQRKAAAHCFCGCFPESPVLFGFGKFVEDFLPRRTLDCAGVAFEHWFGNTVVVGVELKHFVRCEGGSVRCSQTRSAGVPASDPCVARDGCHSHQKRRHWPSGSVVCIHVCPP